MEYIGVLVVAALVFGVCFLIDKGFTKLFRSQAQHRSGLAVRLNKKYGAFGLILFALGVAGIFAGLGDSWLLIAGGALFGVFSALTRFAGFEYVCPLEGTTVQILGVVAYVLLIGYLWFDSVRVKPVRPSDDTI